ncbi:MAG: hypothetical protein LJE70_16585, partial [Chromatiaceae bacterium]|nr:hypothetical protein [Chromatiaceae bacterium]
MAGSDSSKGSGVWYKLALWAVVIVAGFAYLTVIKEKGSEEGSDEGMAQLAAEVQVREMASR